MINSKISIGLLTLTSLFVGNTAVADDECITGLSSIQIGEDLLLEYSPFDASLNQDRDYTGGGAIALRTCPNDNISFSFLNPQIDIVKDVLKLSYANKDVDKWSYLSAFGYEAYTPDDLAEPQTIKTDRPYSNILYLSNTAAASFNGGDEAVEATITVGVLGLGLGKTMQEFFHGNHRASTGLATPVDPLGWHNQISNGFEPTALISVGYFKRLQKPVKYLDIILSSELMAGYYVKANMGFMAKFGIIDTSLPVENIVRHGGILNQPASRKPYQGGELYLFAGVRANFIGYNVLLQGQFRDSEFELKPFQIRRMVYDATVGIGATIGFLARDHSFLSYCTVRTSEHYLAEQRNHSWCGLNYSYGF